MREMKKKQEKDAILSKLRMDKIRQEARIEAQRELDEESYRLHTHAQSKTQGSVPNFMAAANTNAAGLPAAMSSIAPVA